MKEQRKKGWIDALIKEMTIEEKATLCSGKDYWATKELEHRGISSITVADGPHGVRCTSEADNTGIAKGIPATCFPTASALGASWNRALLREIGVALGEECKELGVDILLGPGINMKRSPLCGRNFEYFSEDPFLSGELGTDFVLGVQSQGVGTSLKHYACNNSEYERMTISAEVEERTLREIYLTAFERVVKKADPWTIMCAYNKINGVQASEHKQLMTDILRNEWGYQGAVISDWGAVSDRVESIKAGLDMEMPGPAPYNDIAIASAVAAGRLKEEELNQVVKHNLELLEKTKGKELSKYDREAHHGLARKAAAESIVLLKNEGNILPLTKTSKITIAIIGKTAVTPRYQGAGSSQVTPSDLDIPMDEIKAVGGTKVKLLYAQGYGETEELLLEEAVELAGKCDVALLFTGLPDQLESEGVDRAHINMPKEQNDLIEAVAAVQKKSVVILSNGSAVAMPWVEKVPAILEGWLTGQGMGRAVAEVLFGIVNPSGKLSETFPRKLEDNPSYLNFPGDLGKTYYGEGIFIGYRYYEKKKIQPLFAFGHGLSYSSFKYTELKLQKKSLIDTDKLKFSINITNTGTHAGAEVIQVYITDEEASVAQPEKALCAFEKIQLNPGEIREVSFEVEPRAFSYFNPLYKKWIIESGYFNISVGSSSEDIRLKGRFYLESTQRVKRILTRDCLIKEWLQDETGKRILTRELEGVLDEIINPENPYREMVTNIPLNRIPSLSRGVLTTEDVDRMVQEAKNSDCRTEG